MEEDPIKTGFMLSQAMYERLKFMALILLPALGTLYFTLGSLWGLPNPEQVVGTITAIDTFLGFILRASSKTYDNSYVGKGTVWLAEDPETNGNSVGINVDILDLMEKETIVLKVTPPR